ncbi:MAG: uroporphyrinogen decarboxylase family protein [Candidatus Promineifilaceae bacterium]
MKAWSKRRRLEAAIAGRDVDRPPVALWRHWPGDDQDAEALALAHLQWQSDYDWDFVKVSPASSFCLRDWGVEDRWQGSLEGTRDYTCRVINRPEDWERLPVLDPGRGALAVQLDALTRIGRVLGRPEDGGAPFLATLFSPLAQAKNLAGGEMLLAHLRGRPEAFGRGLETITQSTVAYLQAAAEAGASGVFYAVQHARASALSPAEYEQVGRPYDQAILEAAGDMWLNVLHVHGRDAYLEPFADYAVQLLNWHDRDSGHSLAQALELFGGAVSGGVSRWTLYQESPAAALAEARQALAETGGRRFVLGVGCVAMTNTPLRNIRALRACVEGEGPPA